MYSSRASGFSVISLFLLLADLFHSLGGAQKKNRWLFLNVASPRCEEPSGGLGLFAFLRLTPILALPNHCERLPAGFAEVCRQQAAAWCTPAAARGAGAVARREGAEPALPAGAPAAGPGPEHLPRTLRVSLAAPAGRGPRAEIPASPSGEAQGLLSCWDCHRRFIGSAPG